MKKRTRNTIYKIMIFGLLFVFATIPITGRTSISTRMMVNAIGIDGVDDKYSVTVETLGKENESLKGEGQTVTLAINDIDIKEGKFSELAHCGLIVFGKDTKTDKIIDSLLSLLSKGRINPGSAVICANGKAEDFLTNASKVSGSGAGISELIEFIDQFEHNTTQRIISFLDKLKGKSGAACLPMLEVAKLEGDTGEPVQSNSSSGGGIEGSIGSEEKTELLIVGKNMVYGNKETELGKAESGAYAYFSNYKGTGISDLEHFIVNGKDYGNMAADIESRAGKLKLISPNHIKLIIDAKLRCIDRYKILSAYSEFNMSVEELVKLLSEEFTAKIKGDTEKLIDFCRKESMDILGIRSEIYKYYPSQLKSVEETLGSINIEIETNIRAY